VPDQGTIYSAKVSRCGKLIVVVAYMGGGTAIGKHLDFGNGQHTSDEIIMVR
jgi:hypothetical protein